MFTFYYYLYFSVLNPDLRFASIHSLSTDLEETEVFSNRAESPNIVQVNQESPNLDQSNKKSRTLFHQKSHDSSSIVYENTGARRKEEGRFVSRISDDKEGLEMATLL